MGSGWGCGEDPVAGVHKVDIDRGIAISMLGRSAKRRLVLGVSPYHLLKHALRVLQCISMGRVAALIETECCRVDDRHLERGGQPDGASVDRMAGRRL